MRVFSSKVFLTLVLVILAQVGLVAKPAPDFWSSQPRELTERYVDAYNNADEDWILDFADSLEAISDPMKRPEYKYFAYELRCHHAFYEPDSAAFFANSEMAREYALKFDFIDYYFAETMNVVAFHMNADHNDKARQVAVNMLSEANSMDSKYGFYYGHYALGVILKQCGMNVRAIENFTKCLEYVDKESYSYEGSMCQLNALIAFCHMELKHYDESLKYCEIANSFYEGAEDVYACMAIDYFLKGDDKKFYEYKAKYMEDDNPFSISFDYFNTLLDMYAFGIAGKPSEALAIADGVSDEYSRNAVLAEVYARSGDWQTAYRYNELALEGQYDNLVEDYSDEIATLDAEINKAYLLKAQNERKLYTKFGIVFFCFLILAILTFALHYVINREILVRSQRREIAYTNQYMNLVKNAPFGYSRAKVYYDNSGKVVDYRTIEVNNSLKKSIESTGHIIGQQTMTELYPESAQNVIGKINEAIADGKSFVRFSSYLKELDRYYELIILIDEGYLQIFSLNNTDVIKTQELVEQKNSELTLAKDKLEKSDRIKTKFIQNMSHEIRTPLNAIVGFSQLLSLPEGMLSDEEREEYGKHVINNSDLLTMLVNDVLDMSDIDSGKYTVVVSQAYCNEICNSAISATLPRLSGDIELKYTSDVDDDFAIQSDPRRIKQILINFLSNACKNTAEGSIVLHCSADSEGVIFTCTDTGCGVPPEKTKIIFERFSKLDEFKQGSGLGLNICSDIAVRLGGEIGLDEEYTGGARFYLKLPLHLDS